VSEGSADEPTADLGLVPLEAAPGAIRRVGEPVDDADRVDQNRAGVVEVLDPVAGWERQRLDETVSSGSLSVTVISMRVFTR
jgi:hypothetical protein